MIVINDKEINLKSASTPEEKMFERAWRVLDKKYKLSTGGFVTLKLIQERMTEIVSVNGSGKDRRKRLAYPAGIGVPMKTKYFIDGNPYRAILASKKTLNKQGEIEYKINPLIIKDDTPFYLKDKELILYLFVISQTVKTSSEEFQGEYEKSHPGILYFEDRIADLRVKNTKRRREAQTFNMVEEMPIEKLRRAASVLGVAGFETEERIVLEDAIVDLVNSSEKYYTQLRKFNENFNDEIYVIEENVAKAIKYKLIDWRKGKDSAQRNTIIWFTTGKKEDVYEHLGKIKEPLRLHNYLMDHKEDANLIALLVAEKEDNTPKKKTK